MYKVKFADIGEGLTEGKVAEVLVKVGDTVKAGDPLFFVETDKVNSEIPSPVDGKIASIAIEADQEIKVGDVVMEIDDGKWKQNQLKKMLVLLAQLQFQMKWLPIVQVVQAKNKQVQKILKQHHWQEKLQLQKILI